MSQMLCMAWNYLQISLVNLTNRSKIFMQISLCYFLLFFITCLFKTRTIVEYNIFFCIIYIYLKINIYFTRTCKRRKREKIKIYFVLVAYQITYSTFDCTIITIIIATLNITMLCSSCLACSSIWNGADAVSWSIGILFVIGIC